MCTRSRVKRVPNIFSLSVAEILVLVGGAIPPAPAGPASTRISARLKRVQGHSTQSHTPELCSWTSFRLAGIVVLASTAGAGGGMAPPTSTRISARMKYVQEHSSHVNTQFTHAGAAQTFHVPSKATRGQRTSAAAGHYRAKCLDGVLFYQKT